MAAPKHMDFNERRKAAQEARQAQLEKFRAQPKPDDPKVAEKIAERAAVMQARETRLAERKAAREAEAKRLAAEEAARIAAEKARIAEEAARKAAEERALEAQRKASRDARYAARKARR